MSTLKLKSKLGVFAALAVAASAGACKTVSPDDMDASLTDRNRNFNGANEGRGEWGHGAAWDADDRAGGQARMRCGWRRGQCSDMGEGRGDVAMGAGERPHGRGCSDRRQAAAQSSKWGGSDWSNTNCGTGSAWMGSKSGL
jgi:hypothetical protein